MPVLPSVTSDPRPFPCTPVLDAVRRGAVHLLTISWSCQAPDRVCTRFVSISVPFACCSSSVVIVFTGSPVSITVMCSNNVTQQCKVNVPDVMPLTYNNVKLDLKVGKCRWSGTYTRHLQYEKKYSQTLAVVKRSQKFTSRPRPFPGVRDGQNWISWRWSLPLPTNPFWWGSMHAISSYHGNGPTNTHKQTNPQTGPITIHCAAAS